MIARLMLICLLTMIPAYAQRGGRGADPSANIPMTMSITRIDVIEKMLNLRKEQKKDVKLILDNAQKEAAPSAPTDQAEPTEGKIENAADVFTRF